MVGRHDGRHVGDGEHGLVLVLLEKVLDELVGDLLPSESRQYEEGSPLVYFQIGTEKAQFYEAGHFVLQLEDITSVFLGFRVEFVRLYGIHVRRIDLVFESYSRGNDLALRIGRRGELGSHMGKFKWK